jgi:hypothetical protein
MWELKQTFKDGPESRSTLREGAGDGGRAREGLEKVIINTVHACMEMSQ